MAFPSILILRFQSCEDPLSARAMSCLALIHPRCGLSGRKKHLLMPPGPKRAELNLAWVTPHNTESKGSESATGSPGQDQDEDDDILDLTWTANLCLTRY